MVNDRQCHLHEQVDTAAVQCANTLREAHDSMRCWHGNPTIYINNGTYFKNVFG